MKIITIIISGLFLSLIGCSSNQVNKHQNATAGNSNESNNISSVIAAENITAFENADPKTVIVPYIALLAKLDVIDDAEICLPKHIQTYNALYELNQSSLVAMTMLIACDVENGKKLRNIQELYLATMELLLKKNNGSSKDKAVPIREFSEVEIILATGEYRIIDYEIIEENNHFYYRVHAIDERTGDFEYHYYNNFPFLKKTYLTIKSFTSDAALSKFILSSFLKISNPAAINYITTQFLGAGEYEKIIEYISDSKALTPISRLNLARSYLYTSQDNKLDSLLDDLVAQNDDGDINAGIFLVELLERLNGGKASQKNIQLLLDDVDQRTFVGNGSFLLAKANYSYGDLDNFEKWSDVSLENNSEVTYSKLIEFLKRRKDRNALITLFRKQHKKNNLQATFDLASAYHYGQGVIVDHKVENELYTISSEQGHVDSMYNLANNFENAKFVKQDIDKALYWFKKAGTAKSLNQVGYIYYEGAGGIDVDYSEAMKWFLKASDLGNVFSTSNIGLFYQYGKGVEIDYAKAIDFYKAGITDKYLVTYKRLGDIYQYSLGEKYYDEAEYWYEKGAIAGDLDAYERLGDLYQFQEGFTDLQKAAHWYKLGANKGHVRSQYEYAMIYAKKLNNRALSNTWFDEVYNSSDGQSINWIADSYSSGQKYLNVNLNKAIKFYKKASELGNSDAQINLGYHYEKGNGVGKNLDEARALYEQASNQDNAQAINNLALFYKFGKGGLKTSLKKSFELFLKAASLGNDYAQNNLGKMYYKGVYVDKDYSEALAWFEKAANQNFKHSYFYLGYLYVFGDIEKQDFKKGRDYLEKALAIGSASAADNLGVMYSKGLSVKPNPKTAANYFLAAAKLRENEEPYAYAANVFLFGYWGVEINFDMARKYFKKGLKNGSAMAMNNLGEMYRLGQGVTIDYLKAISLYKKAIEKEDEVAMFNMSEFYRDGLGVKKNANKEFEWMERSANSGFLPAYVDLSRMYKNATGTNKDIIKSIEWLKKGVEEELSSAIYEMSRRLYTGDEISQNIEEAKKLMQVAADAGDEKALEAIESNFKDME